MADLGDERSDIIISDVLDTIPLRSTIDAGVNAVRAKYVKMRIEIASRSPALCERDAARLWILKPKGESFLGVISRPRKSNLRSFGKIPKFFLHDMIRPIFKQFEASLPFVHEPRL